MTQPPEQNRDQKPDQQKAMFAGGAMPHSEPRSWKPFAIAGVAVLAVLALLLLLTRGGHTGASHGGVDPYAASLPISGIQMSDSSGISGDKQTYVDGTITNRGSRTVSGVTVQVAFKDYDGKPAAVDTMPLALIRFRKPYVDTVPVSMAPIQPGQSRDFRLIFDSVPDSWGGAYPEVRVISVDMQ